MNTRYGAFIILVIAASVSAGDAIKAEPVELNCTTVGITVSAEDSNDAERACDTVADADIRLRGLGLEIHDPVLVEVTEALDVAPGSCVALYSRGSRKLQVLPVDCLADRPGRASAFPALASEVLFDSLIVHELVHAYLDQSDGGGDLSRIAHEYLAYSIQLEALPAEDRGRILEKAAIEGPVTLADINEATLNLLPLKFAATAWLHFRAQGGDAAVVQRILERKQVFESLDE